MTSEFRQEAIDRVPDEIAELLKAWDERLVMSDPKSVERYLRGELTLHLHIATRRMDGQANDWCARCSSAGRDAHFINRQLRRATFDDAQASHVCCRDDQDQQSVFIGDIQLANGRLRLCRNKYSAVPASRRLTN